MRTAVLLSGGVDSSVALHRLLATGRHSITAFYLKVWLEDELSFLGGCPWEEDLRFARAVCESAGIPLEVVPLQQAYQEHIVRYTLAELRAGRTPSPDVLCNRHVKLGVFLDQVGDRFDRIATGHYARLRSLDGEHHLHRARDRHKDQTYFLSRLEQRQLARCLFPIGNTTKGGIREEADRLGLPTAARRDSQGLCFLGKIPYAEFVRAHLGEQSGPIRHQLDGAILGEHRGYWFHTLGQRKGLGLSGGPWYVVAKDVATNTLWVARPEDHVAPNRLRLRDLHWIGRPPNPPNCDAGSSLEVKLRHGPATLRARLQRANDEAELVLEQGDAGVAPGQFAVLYEGDRCLGSGVIEAPPAGNYPRL